MKQPLRVVAALSVFAMLVTAGFITAAQVGDVAILPMPSEGLEFEHDAEQQGADVGRKSEAGETTGTVGADEAAEEEAGDGAIAADEVTREATGNQASDEAGRESAHANDQAEREFESEWTKEELAALREMARERIAAREMMSQISDYLKNFWEEELSVWLDEAEKHAPSKDEVLDSVDTWLEERNLPESARWFERWGDIVGAIADSTGIALDDAKEIGREWVDSQRDLIEEIVEDVKELREDLREELKSAAKSTPRDGEKTNA